MQGLDIWLSPFNIWKAMDLIVSVFVVGIIAFVIIASGIRSLFVPHGQAAVKTHRSATYSERHLQFEDGFSKPYTADLMVKESSDHRRDQHSERC